MSRNSCSSLQKPHLLSLQYHLAPLISFYRSVTSSSRDTNFFACLRKPTVTTGLATSPYRRIVMTSKQRRRGIRHIARRLTRRQSTAATTSVKKIREEPEITRPHTPYIESFSESLPNKSSHPDIRDVLFYKPVYLNTDSFSVHETLPLSELPPRFS